MTTRFFLGARAAEVQGCVLTQAFAFGLKPHQLLLDSFRRGHSRTEGAISTRLHRGERERSFRHTLARG